jgi:spore germination cell wall hydrolase CwlJ-like protein
VPDLELIRSLLFAALAAPLLLASASLAEAAGGKKDVACLAEAVYFEARGTGTEGEAAVAHVIVNRSHSPKFPDSVCGVVADGCQFSYRCDGRSDTLVDPKARARAYRIAETVLAADDDPTNGALFFHSAKAAPGWFAKRKRVGTIGGNVFYR